MNVLHPRHPGEARDREPELRSSPRLRAPRRRLPRSPSVPGRAGRPALGAGRRWPCGGGPRRRHGPARRAARARRAPDPGGRAGPGDARGLHRDLRRVAGQPGARARRVDRARGDRRGPRPPRRCRSLGPSRCAGAEARRLLAADGVAAVVAPEPAWTRPSCVGSGSLLVAANPKARSLPAQPAHSAVPGARRRSGPSPRGGAGSSGSSSGPPRSAGWCARCPTADRRSGPPSWTVSWTPWRRWASARAGSGRGCCGSAGSGAGGVHARTRTRPPRR